MPLHKDDTSTCNEINTEKISMVPLHKDDIDNLSSNDTGKISMTPPHKDDVDNLNSDDTEKICREPLHKNDIDNLNANDTEKINIASLRKDDVDNLNSNDTEKIDMEGGGGGSGGGVFPVGWHGLQPGLARKVWTPSDEFAGAVFKPAAVGDTAGEANDTEKINMAPLHKDDMDNLNSNDTEKINMEGGGGELQSDLELSACPFVQAPSLQPSMMLGHSMPTNTRIKYQVVSGDGAPATPGIRNAHLHKSHTSDVHQESVEKGCQRLPDSNYAPVQIQHDPEFEVQSDIEPSTCPFVQAPSLQPSMMVGHSMPTNTRIKCQVVSGDGAPATPGIRNTHPHKSHTSEVHQESVGKGCQGLPDSKYAPGHIQHDPEYELQSTDHVNTISHGVVKSPPATEMPSMMQFQLRPLAHTYFTLQDIYRAGQSAHQMRFAAWNITEFSFQFGHLSKCTGTLSQHMMFTPAPSPPLSKNSRNLFSANPRSAGPPPPTPLPRLRHDELLSLNWMLRGPQAALNSCSLAAVSSHAL